MPSQASAEHAEVRHDPGPDTSGRDDEDEFDSDAFREWMRNRARTRFPRRRQPESDDDGRGDRDDHRSSTGPPPDWDGESSSFLDYQIKAKLWLATAKARPRTRGPLLLQKLSKSPFQAMKYLAKDNSWMTSDQNGEELLRLMDLPENFGEDKEEDLISSLARITYHLRRGRDETHRDFFSRWDQAMRKVNEHKIYLPETFVGFLMVNALAMGDSDIKSLLNFSRGSIRPADIRDFVRKHETKLQVSQVGVDRKTTTSRTSSSAHFVTTDSLDQDEEEIHAVEEALRDLRDEDDGNDDGLDDESTILEEHETAEILSTLLAQKKKTYTQTLKAKKQKELSRGYGNKWKGGKSLSVTGTGTPPFREGQFKMTIEELKKVTKCGICHRVGHWHRECPEKDKHKTGPKETNFLEMEEAIFCGRLQHSGPAVQRVEPATQSNSPEASDNTGPGACETATHGAYMSDLPVFDVLFGDGCCNIDSLGTPGNPIYDDGCATLDTGCQRMAIGRATLERFVHQLPGNIPVKLTSSRNTDSRVFMGSLLPGMWPPSQPAWARRGPFSNQRFLTTKKVRMPLFW